MTILELSDALHWRSTRPWNYTDYVSSAFDEWGAPDYRKYWRLDIGETQLDPTNRDAVPGPHLYRSAGKTAGLLTELGVREWLASHCSKSRWLRPEWADHTAHSYLCAVLPRGHWYTFSGALLLTDVDTDAFINTFVDYPGLLLTQDIELVAADVPLALRFNNHFGMRSLRSWSDT